MTKRTFRVWIGISLIILWGVACSVLGGGEEKAPTAAPQPTQAPAQAEPTSAISAQQGGGGGEQTFDTEFPLPKDVQGFMHLEPGDSAINFQTKMTIDETMAFYRKELTGKGLSEETLLTVIDKDKKSFSMVFRGSSNGKALVIQGVDLGNGTLNVNIRYEDV